jgi:predicted transcriptional regulator
MEKTLGPLEMKVLGLLASDEALSVADVQKRLASEGHASAYTTVLTVLKRLHDKGVVRRAKQGKQHVYRATARDGAIKRTFLQKVKRALFSDRVAPVAALIEDDMTRAELLELKKIIDERLGKKA